MFNYGDFLMLSDGKVVFITKKDKGDGYAISLETAKKLHAEKQVVGIQVEEDGEEYFKEIDGVKL